MGNIRKLPAQEERVETGAIQFGDDWPGAFIRGDEAFFLAGSLYWVIPAINVETDDFNAKLAKGSLKRLHHILTNSDLSGMTEGQRSFLGTGNVPSRIDWGEVDHELHAIMAVLPKTSDDLIKMQDAIHKLRALLRKVSGQ